jgi:hypothetical protein
MYSLYASDLTQYSAIAFLLSSLNSSASSRVKSFGFFSRYLFSFSHSYLVKGFAVASDASLEASFLGTVASYLLTTPFTDRYSTKNS